MPGSDVNVVLPETLEIVALDTVLPLGLARVLTEYLVHRVGADTLNHTADQAVPCDRLVFWDVMRQRHYFRLVHRSRELIKHVYTSIFLHVAKKNPALGGASYGSYFGLIRLRPQAGNDCFIPDCCHKATAAAHR